MNEMRRWLWKGAHLAWLAAGFSQFLLGLGVARYFGVRLLPGPTLLGLGWVMSLQLAGQFLYLHFVSVPPTTESERARRLALLVSFSALGVAGFCAVGLLQIAAHPAVLAILMGLMLLVAVGHSTPPLRLWRSGYGELSLAVSFGALVPMMAYYSVATGELQRLLGAVAFPLVFLILALLLLVQFASYGRDEAGNRRTLLVRLGWELGMQVHNGLLLAGFLLLAISPWLGMPPAIVLPTFAALPLVGLQIVMLGRIANGSPPNWRSLTVNGIAIAAAVSYLLGFGFWTR